jgi:peptidoglycan LD-endopeptidase LytH
LKIFLFLILFSLFFLNSLIADSLSVFDKWNSLDKKISLNKIDKNIAQKLIKKYEIEVIRFFYEHSGKDVKRYNWIFPLKNFSTITFYKNGMDYNDTDYDFFDGNKSWNHPSNDISIADTNKDCLDDVTGKPVDVVSMSSGIVISTDTTWEPGLILRAGKFIRIYDVTNKKILYYSHLKVVFKKPGDIVNAGEKIGEVGRTGRSAFLIEGDTHLHIALLYVEGGYPYPEPIIKDLKRAEKREIK